MKEEVTTVLRRPMITALMYVARYVLFFWVALSFWVLCFLGMCIRFDCSDNVAPMGLGNIYQSGVWPLKLRFFVLFFRVGSYRAFEKVQFQLFCATV